MKMTHRPHARPSIARELLVFVAASVLFVPFTAPAELVDGILASVGNEVILLSDIQAEMQPQIQMLREEGLDQEQFSRRVNELVRETLEQAINSKILLREALLLGIEVDDDRIEQRIEEMRESFPTDEEFMDELAAAGESLSDFRERIRKQFLSQIMAGSKLQEIEERIVVSQQELTDYYEENKDEYFQAERVFIRQIFLRARTDEDRAKARARLEQLKAEIESGADFADLARAHSEMLGAADGGVVGWHRRGELVAQLEDAAFALPEGGVSHVLETPGGVTLLKVDERIEAKTPTLEELRSVVEREIRDEKAQVAYEKWLNDLRRRSEVRVFL